MASATASLRIKACGGDRAKNLRAISTRLQSLTTTRLRLSQQHEVRGLTEQLEIIASELDEAEAKPPATVGALAVCTVTVTDPDSGLPVEVEIYKLATGGMVGVDGSWLAADEGPTYSPFDCVDGHPVELDFGDEH